MPRLLAPSGLGCMLDGCDRPLKAVFGSRAGLCIDCWRRVPANLQADCRAAWDNAKAAMRRYEDLRGARDALARAWERTRWASDVKRVEELRS